MNWNFDLEEALARCRYLGGPADQQALLTLLREVQDHCGGSLPQAALEEIAGALGVKCSFLAAIVRRYPSLRLAGAAHRLELCGSLWRRPMTSGPAASAHGATSAITFPDVSGPVETVPAPHGTEPSTPASPQSTFAPGSPANYENMQPPLQTGERHE